MWAWAGMGMGILSSESMACFSRFQGSLTACPPFSLSSRRLKNGDSRLAILKMGTALQRRGSTLWNVEHAPSLMIITGNIPSNNEMRHSPLLGLLERCRIASRTTSVR
ncbi:hypothetical protein F5Y15DRAFT_252814 [Xylariaceae sp. FL0016]|nr:hypothetical protein F5Y15DRAFT_252814 [Xylariaceae sp. FL0016]